jgi:molybdopterin molybdotransferase
MQTNISLEEAQETLLSLAKPTESEESVRLEEALGRVLSKSIKAPYQLPPFSKSPLDGYALRAEDIEQATPAEPVIIKVIEEIHAGYVAKSEVVAGTTIKLMTGSPMPKGADIVIKYEDIERTADAIRVFQPLKKDSNVIFAGEDVAAGEVIANSGDVVTPALVGALAAVGIAMVPVYKKVDIAILSTGDELVEPSEALPAGKIYNSNLHGLRAACSNLATNPIMMGTVDDDKEKIVNKLLAALEISDIVITTGGVSVGDYDLVPDAILEINAGIIFKGVKLKPGSPIIVAKKQNKFIIALSGNSAAATVTFQLIAIPLIKKIMGLKEYFVPTTKAVLMSDFNKKSQQRRFLRGVFQIDYAGNSVILADSQSNGALKSMIGCNALIDIPAGTQPLVKGQVVSVILTGEL